MAKKKEEKIQLILFRKDLLLLYLNLNCAKQKVTLKNRDNILICLQFQHTIQKPNIHDQTYTNTKSEEKEINLEDKN